LLISPENCFLAPVSILPVTCCTLLNATINPCEQSAWLLELERRRRVQAATESLDGKIAIVTGAGSGLGLATAQALAAHGACVAVTELPARIERAEATVGEIAAAGGQAFAVPLDVTDLASIDSAVAHVLTTSGRIDILVNNAGLNIAKPAFDVTEEDWDRVVDVNLKGLFFMAQAAGRAMRDQSPSGGVIINISSIMGLVGYFDRAAYCASKAGVVNLTRVLAIEWTEHDIRVNAVCPTFVETELNRHLFADATFRDEILRRTPLKRLGTPEEVAAAVVFLASPAASLITGHALATDGGWTAI
jgi:2-deoxy-D-gluconate 3-dehydrogenase